MKKNYKITYILLSEKCNQNNEKIPFVLLLLKSY